MWRVTWSKFVEKQLQRIPSHIAEKFRSWVVAVEEIGLMETRKLPGLHDEPLAGKRKGQRSVRLNRAYRAIYVQDNEKEIKIIEVIEVSKHEY
jgi:proteic killer suppression protein